MKHSLKKGSKVYCSCYVGNKQDNKSFFCRGVVVDVINDTVHKVLVTGVNTFHLGEPVSNRLLKALLGKTVPRSLDQLSTSLSVIAEKLYAGGKWLSWEEDKIKRIIQQQKDKKLEEKKNVARDTPIVHGDARVVGQTGEEVGKVGEGTSPEPVLLSTPIGPEQTHD